MMEGNCLGKKKRVPLPQDYGFTDLVFSWSLEDIFDEDLYKYQVEKIPLSFQTEEQYLSSFVFPLLEETRAELASSMEIMNRAPFAEVISLDETKPYGTMLYDVTVDNWKNRFSERGKEPYKTLPSDMIILVDRKPETVSDLQRAGSTWAFALVTNITEDDNEDDSTSLHFKVKSSHPIEFHDGMNNSLFAVFLMNITTSKRIWNSLHMRRNLNIIKEVLCDDSVVEKNCNICPLYCKSQLAQDFDSCLMSKLNESQREAIMVSLSKLECGHMSSVELIWGPPGTGKTTTVGVMLFILLKRNLRTITCAPTNVAVTQVASRVLSFVREMFTTVTASGESFCSFGDILLFGNKQRLKLGGDVELIYMEHRVERLTDCLGPLTGWRHCISAMIDLLEYGVSQYHIFVENEASKTNINQNEEKVEIKSFLVFMQNRFQATVLPLRKCILTFCTHLPRSYMGEDCFQNMIRLLDFLSSLEVLLFQENWVSEELKDLFALEVSKDESAVLEDLSSLNYLRTMSLLILRSLRTSLEELRLPSVLNKHSILEFCYQRASLIFCTTSSSYKLHSVEMEPLNLLVIDEAAQLKESESTIPLQLPGLRNAILIGDERQLPAMVQSNICSEVGYARSLFERLSSLGHFKHLLNVQYRMHPSISLFPNKKFYQNQILDAENVVLAGYEMHYLPGPMFSCYSFINVVGGKEERDDVGHSLRNMVEVAVVVKILQNLFKAWKESKKKVSIGVVSPYAAQIVSIQDVLGKKYENLDGFSVKVKTVDGFQGGEEDIIIISTVRSNASGSVGFLSSPQRTNVALTRARHSLWILGNEKTLASSESVWKALVCDARRRHCLFDADADESLKKTIVDAKKELEQLDDLLDGNSVLFKDATWKVLFSDNFRKSFGKLNSSRIKHSVLNLLLKLSSGWRPKNKNVDSLCESASQIMKQFKVEGLYVVCTIDVVKEFKYVQVLKVWDILPLDEIPKLAKRLDSIFAMYTDDYKNRCKAKCLEGNLEIPKSWLASQDLVRFRNLSNTEADCEANISPGDGRSYLENSKVSESLLLMKFYSLSSGVVRHLLSDRDSRELDLPMQVTDEQMDLILFEKSSFIIGRSGTGKTTVLTMKLFQNEQSFHIASEGFYEAEGSRSKDDIEVESLDENRRTVLRQLFVTVSPKLCHAVKQQVSHLTSFACHWKSSEEDTSMDYDDVDTSAEFNDIPDSFLNVPENKYPLVITFHKFLMMMDGTFGNSYFERFHEARELSHGTHRTLRSVILQTFIRKREVTYDRFCSLYWPHFNAQLTKKLDASRVFTEIISHIKGGLQAGETAEGKLSRDGYSSLSECRVSALTEQEREIVYNLFEDYEKMKIERGDFDLGDLVNDLHRRLKSGKYEGDQMDFIYIDEVQDLSMRQISLFKYICQNVDEGFIFAGDTAQTIARGIDFRFQDIRSLFYKEFISTGTTGRKEKGLVSEIFQLKQNFRTHAGVLELAQSIIGIIYHYFPHSIDVLEPETSFISGEPPVLLESGNNENAIVTIFGGSRSHGDIVGFGAEQVILVRDDGAKTEICEYVGKHALVLTIVECKGLEFQDVLLYNFFGSSPLKDQWRVIYGYMKEQDLLDGNLPSSFPSFSHTRHNVLCSELKQLYVAITRTRQRLWICENKEELSKPMFDYWKRRGLVQLRKLDDSMAQAMQVASSADEWRERGIKLFRENNFVMATMCFERAGDMVWEKRAKASGLRASAEQLRISNPEVAFGYLREAAEIFDSIGKPESAAICYCDLGEYERAGKIYLDKCGKLEKAAECFALAGCYSDAAEVYAKGNHYSKCLSVCKSGKFYDMGLQYIEYWKEHVHEERNDILKIEQEFLENCALDYYEHKDHKSMIRFVRAFHSMESKREFLKSLGCLDELLLLEEESGNFLNAAELARLRGDVLKEADLLGKAGCYNEACSLILLYVVCNSLWGNGSRGWPLKSFAQKDELCLKAESFAKMDSDFLYGLVCNELKLLSDRQSNLCDLKNRLHASVQGGSVRGEILSLRKILDSHLRLNSSKYDWEDELPVEMNTHSEDKISQNRVSLRTLIFYWNLWRGNIINILESLCSLQNQESGEHEGHLDFSLNYFGVRKQFVKANMVYSLVKPEAEWVRKVGDKALQRNGELQTLDAGLLAFASRSYWQSELLSVGMKILETLDALYKVSKRSSLFHQGTSLLHIFEVSKFLLDCGYLNLTFNDKKKLENFLGISTTYFDIVFPLDWRKSLTVDLNSLRETDLSFDLLEEIILQNVDIRGELNYWKVGRVMMVWLGSRKPVELYKKIIRGLDWNVPWKSFVEVLGDEHVSVAPIDATLVNTFMGALEDTYRANWRCPGYMSPHCFVYLVERLMIMASLPLGFFFTMKSSFLEWFIHRQSGSTTTTTLPAGPQFSSEHFFDFVVRIVQQFLYNKEETKAWAQNSKETKVRTQNSNTGPSYLQLLVLKLFMILSIIGLKFPKYSEVLLDLLTRNYITCLLPGAFVNDLLRRRKGRYLNLNVDLVAAAFLRIGDPLMVVSLEKRSPIINAPGAIFVDMVFTKTREDIMGALFPMKTTRPCGQTPPKNEDGGRITEAESSNIGLDSNKNMNSEDRSKGEQLVNWKILEEISEALNSIRNEEMGNSLSSLPRAAGIKGELDEIVSILAAACTKHDGTVFSEEASWLEGLKRLSSAFGTSQHGQVYTISSIRELVKGLQIRTRVIDEFIKQSFMDDKIKVMEEVASESNCATETQNKEEDGQSKAEVATEKQTGDNNQDAQGKNVSKAGNNQDAKGKKGKGNNKAGKSKKSKGKRKK